MQKWNIKAYFLEIKIIIYIMYSSAYSHIKIQNLFLFNIMIQMQMQMQKKGLADVCHVLTLFTISFNIKNY